METPEHKTLVLGIGNYLMGDEGVGVYVAQQLARQQPAPSGLDVLDGGTGGFHLMGAMENYPFVVMVDATLDGLPAGTIRRIEPRFSADFPRAMSTHDVGLRDVVEAMCIRESLPKILLYVVSITEARPMHIGLSPAVQEAADTVLAEIQNMPSRH